jgi:hypothetical protein
VVKLLPDKRIIYIHFIVKLKLVKHFHGYFFLNFFHVVMTEHFGMKLYNDEPNAQVFNLFIYLLLPYMFRGFLFSPSSEAGVQLRRWFQSAEYGVSIPGADTIPS